MKVELLINVMVIAIQVWFISILAVGLSKEYMLLLLLVSVIPHLKSPMIQVLIEMEKERQSKARKAKEEQST